MALTEGDLIDGKYRVLRLIGRGGMGVVYEGENVRIRRKVAIKVLHAPVALDTQAVQRFEREAKAVARIGSEHIADVFDLGDLPTGERFMVMELLEGETLASRTRTRGRLEPHEAVTIAMEVLEGLERVHEAGIIHRDLKPANVFLVKKPDRDFVKILDFGICKIRPKDSHVSTTSMPSSADATTTDVKVILGTLSYMSPEQLLGERAVDGRSDLYAVGVMLYRCLSGVPPYQASSVVDFLIQFRAQPPTPIESLVEGLDRGLVKIIHKALERDVDARFQTAREFREALAEWAGRVDRLLTEFLGLKYVPVAKSAPSASAPIAQSSSGGAVPRLAMETASESFPATVLLEEPPSPDALARDPDTTTNRMDRAGAEVDKLLAAEVPRYRDAEDSAHDAPTKVAPPALTAALAAKSARAAVTVKVRGRRARWRQSLAYGLGALALIASGAAVYFGYKAMAAGPRAAPAAPPSSPASAPPASDEASALASSSAGPAASPTPSARPSAPRPLPLPPRPPPRHSK